MSWSIRIDGFIFSTFKISARPLNLIPLYVMETFVSTSHIYIFCGLIRAINLSLSSAFKLHLFSENFVLFLASDDIKPFIVLSISSVPLIVITFPSVQ